MLKPPASTMPGMTDTLDFVKNLWGSMHLPGTGMPGMGGMAAPSLSPEDLDKRIADLKAVESWLNMNLTMLRGTIQSMEVQRGTLAAMKSMGASMADAMRQSGVSADKMAGMPFAAFFGAAPAAQAPAAAASNANQDAGAGAAPGTPAGDANPAAAGMPAALAWWSALQDQFAQAVTAAMGPAGASTRAAVDAAPADGKPQVTPSDAPAAPSSDTENGVAGGTGQTGGAGSGKARTPRARGDKA